MKPRQPAKSLVPNPAARHTPSVDENGALTDKDDRKIDSRLVCVQDQAGFLRLSC